MWRNGAYWNREKGMWEKMGCVEAKESGEWEEVRGVGEKKGKMGCIGIEKKGRGRKWDEVEQRKVENGKK